MNETLPVLNCMTVAKAEHISFLHNVRYVSVPAIPVYAPARPHRRRRIAKKWLKRYGMKVVGYNRYLGANIIIDELNHVAYSHAEVLEQLRLRMNEALNQQAMELLK